MAWNDWLFWQINGSSESLAPVMHFFSEATNHGWVRGVLGLIILAMIARGAKSRRTAIEALLAVAIANGLTDLFKNFHPEPRPYQQLADALLHNGTHAATQVAGMAGNYGTASAHSANMAAVAFAFTYNLRWWGAPWVGIALIVGYSRIYLAAHYPYQVLLGYGCGCLAAVAVCKTWDLVRRLNERKGRSLEAETAN